MKTTKFVTGQIIFFSALLLFLGNVSNTSSSLFQPAHAAQDPGQQEWMYHKKDIVDESFVKQYSVIPRRNDVVIIDSRPKARKYDKGHIPTAISLPVREFKRNAHMLPQDKNTLLIMYCGGLQCEKSHKSAYLAEEMGYNNVKVYAAGYPDWIKKGNLPAVSTEYIRKAIDNNKNVVIVDTRPKKRKYDKGHIPTAINIPDRQFEQMLDKMPADKSTEVVFYCGGYQCTKSVTTAEKAIQQGYTKVRIYPAGFPAWKQAYAGDVAGAVAATSKVKSTRPQIKPGEEEGTISVESFQQVMTESRDAILLIDARPPSQFNTATIRGAVNMPLDELDKKLDSLPDDKPIIFFCNRGGTAGEAYDTVKEFRPELEAYFLSAEMSCDREGNYTITPIE